MLAVTLLWSGLCSQVGCQSTGVELASSKNVAERYQQWEDNVDVALWTGDIGRPLLEKLLLQDECKEMEACFPDLDERELEQLLFELKPKIAIGASRYYVFEDLLVQFYYGDVKTVRALSAEQQIQRAVRTLVRYGPKNERAIPRVTFEIHSQIITNGTAEVECSLYPEAQYKVSLRKRTIADTVVWIPVSLEKLAVY